MAIRVFVNGVDRWLGRLRQELAEALQELELEEETLSLYDQDPPSGVTVSLVLYFSDGSARLLPRELAAAQSFLEAGVPVIPVLDTVAGFRQKVPQELGYLNAFALGVEQPDFTGLVAEILDRAWQLRPKRKVFLSYRRVDAAAVARQLQDQLTNRGYEVFLDESSIPPGADFQRELKSWLNDADFLLLLASPGVAGSKWVLEEIEFANHASVAILALCWPVALAPGSAGSGLPPEVSALMEDQKHALRSASFDGEAEPAERKLAGQTLDEILIKVDSFRARAVQHRLRCLVPFIRRIAAEGGVTMKPAERFGDFRVTSDPAGPRGYIRVLPYRPTLESLSDLRRELMARNDADVAACFYAENDVNHPQKIALDWALLPTRPKGEAGPTRYRLLAHQPTPGAVAPDLAGLLR